MNGTGLVLTIAAILFAAFLLGWFAHWALHRFARVEQGDMTETDRMAQARHEAEAARDQAIARMQGLEAEMNSRLAQAEAELATTMEALGHARAEAEDLRARIRAE